MPTKRKPPSGHVSIAEEVVSSIARIAAQEVEGISGLKGTVADGLADLLNAQKRQGVSAQLIEDQTIRIRLKAVVRYGSPIPEVAKRVQAKVKQEIEGMTGLRVGAVDVYVQEIDTSEISRQKEES